jgi:hypothetical protein
VPVTTTRRAAHADLVVAREAPASEAQQLRDRDRVMFLYADGRRLDLADVCRALRRPAGGVRAQLDQVAREHWLAYPGHGPTGLCAWQHRDGRPPDAERPADG